jgi:hypothetical protein
MSAWDVKGTDVIKSCKRCNEPVFIVHTETPGPILRVPLDIEPVSGPAVGLMFEHCGDGYWLETKAVRPGMDAIHVTHHCQPPARCKWCEQVHTTTITTTRKKDHNE